MSSLITWIAVLLIFVILVLIFRIQKLVAVLKGSNDQIGTSNKVNAALMVIVPFFMLLAVVYYSPAMSAHFLPEASSIHGKWTDDLFWDTIAIISAMFVITNIALFWFAFKYQYNPNRKATFYHDNTRLEIFWTIIPAVIMALLVFWGYTVWDKIMRMPVPENAEIVEIMGKQFGWQVRYPGKDNQLGKYDFRLTDDAAGNEFGIDFEDPKSFDDFTATEMHIPVDKPIQLKIRARDVLHSVFIPHMRVKMDAVPGMPTQFVFTPTKSTQQMRDETGNPKFNYEIACTEICGRGHFGMKMILVVDDAKDYKKWIAAQTPVLEQKPELKGKGMSQFRKKNLADKKEQEKNKVKASL